jgi:hypothetical protein
MTNPKDIHPIVMKVLDELSEKYFIHKPPLRVPPPFPPN